jgi:HAD superfamily 5'-nucleotidase-like hydrolase
MSENEISTGAIPGKIQDEVAKPVAERGIFCNRTLNMRSIKAIGYDMDYTLIHYNVEEWERRAYEYIKQAFLAKGWPVQNLVFDPHLVCRGLIIDTEKGNVVKANRFGFVKRALHGAALLDFEAQRDIYSREIVDLSEKRWVFLNTLFSISEGCMYAQLVDLLDQKKLPEVLGYADLYRRVRATLDTTHAEGRLKAEIVADPDRFVVLDPEMPLALLDQKFAGKKLMLITNSEWSYTVSMMTYAFDRFLPAGMTWRNVFDVVIVGARKPDFFRVQNPIFEVVTEEGLLAPAHGELFSGRAYLGGSAVQVEKSLKLSGDEILYVGDHMFGDVKITKSVLRWRTALILRELEDEVCAVESFRSNEALLEKLMKEKEDLENRSFRIKLALQRMRDRYGNLALGNGASSLPSGAEGDLQSRLLDLRQRLEVLDEKIAPLARAISELNNPRWGLLMRAGNDKSHLARQVERYADIYTSRVSNLLFATPFVYLRSPRGSLPHDH